MLNDSNILLASLTSEDSYDIVVAHELNDNEFVSSSLEAFLQKIEFTRELTLFDPKSPWIYRWKGRWESFPWHAASLSKLRPDLRVTLAKYPLKPKRLSLMLLKEKDHDVRVRMAESTTSSLMVDRLKHDEDPKIRLALLRNWAMNEEDLWAFREDQDPRVWEMLATVKRTPKDMTALVARKCKKYGLLDACRTLSQYNKISEEALRILASHEDEHVRINVASSTNSKSLLSSLSRDKSPNVRAEVASNSETTRSVLKRLFEEDPVKFVRRIAKEKLREK